MQIPRFANIEATPTEAERAQFRAASREVCLALRNSDQTTAEAILEHFLRGIETGTYRDQERFHVGDVGRFFGCRAAEVQAALAPLIHEGIMSLGKNGHLLIGRELKKTGDQLAQYLVVADHIRDRLEVGGDLHDHPFVRSSDFVHDYAAGRPTILRALQELVKTGDLERGTGQGRYDNNLAREGTTIRTFLVRQVAIDIGTGALERRSRLTRRDLCREYGVTSGEMDSALGELGRRGFIHPDAARGGSALVVGRVPLLDRPLGEQIASDFVLAVMRGDVKPGDEWRAIALMTAFGLPNTSTARRIGEGLVDAGVFEPHNGGWLVGDVSTFGGAQALEPVYPVDWQGLSRTQEVSF